MLIRTQDKKGIVNLDNMESLCITEIDSGFNIIITFSDGAYMIGKYTSETLANYILDAIESEYLKVTAGRNGLNQTPVVYHMPEDWEAKS